MLLGAILFQIAFQSSRIGENGVLCLHAKYLNHHKRMFSGKSERAKAFGGQKSSSLNKPLLSGELPSEAVAHNEQAHIFFSNGLYEEAILSLKESLLVVEKYLGARHNEAATLMVSIALVYEKLKMYEECSKYLSDALEIRKQCDGENHTSVAIVLYKLALVWCNRGDLEKAFPLVNHAEKIMNGHVDLVEQKLKQKQTSSDLLEELEHRKLALNTELGHVLNVRGVLHYQQREFKKSEKYWNKAVEVWERCLLSDESVATLLLDVHKNLVALYKTTNHLDAAVKASERCIKALESRFPASPILPLAYQLSAQIYERAQMFDLANSAWEQAYQLITQIHEQGHEEIDEIFYALNLSKAKLAAGNPKPNSTQ
ncbi:kinesin light chain-like isoform X2 [Schistocerca gregaria]|uniref:kinesin light chain-like isoform X2 n=1 Tax=Schistocerca gregaria TaxID=7010 RepID=UPI00211DD96C|nr:kinesin light chain-like isoform X2 [Schistocerca gregaria]